ncbi:MAG: hypothetical protein Q8Q65_03320 [bacterium]|nr:hypothetical protein [bacterium]
MKELELKEPPIDSPIKKNKQKKQRAIAFDFDGVIHQYSGWNEGQLGEPIVGAADLIKLLQANGAEVIIFTAREEDSISAWLIKHDINVSTITNEKLPRIDVFVDDRAWCFLPLDYEDITLFANRLLTFKPYWA